MTGQAAAVEVEGLHKSFALQRSWRGLLRPRGRADVRVALDDVALRVAPGEFFGLLGRNGAGKSTLFKVLATLIHPDRGTVRVDGHDVVNESREARRALVPVIPNERSLYWRLSARENLALFAALYGLDGRQARQRVEEVLSIVGLTETGRQQVGLFSSGMKQRLLIARALLGSPRILLLDEPTRSLDPVSARSFRRFLRDDLARGTETTILLATHDYEEVTELCQRVAVLEAGRVVATGRTAEVLAASQRRRTTLWTDTPEHPALGREVERLGGQVVGVSPAPDGETAGWHIVELELATGEASHADLLTALVAAGVRIARFSQAPLSLAQLLEHVTAQQGGR